MGLFGWTTFLKQTCPNLGHTVVLSEEHLCIDGNSTIHFLARQINPLKGSQYLELQQLVRRFSAHLSKRSVFVFDGAIESYKITTREERYSAKARDLQIVVDGALRGDCSPTIQRLALSLMPPMALICAINTLREVGFECIVALGEADSLINRISRKRGCTVLSNDSDFMISNIPAFITLESMSALPSSTSGNNLITAIKCNRTQLGRVLNINQNHFHILALLAGSDIMSRVETNVFYQLNPLLGVTNVSTVKRLRKLVQLCSLMARIENLDLAYLVILKRLNKDWVPKIKAYLTLARLQYEEDDGKISPLSPFELDVNAGLKSPRLIEIIHSSVFYCSPMLEDYSRASPFAYSRYLRKYIYNRLGKESVTEYIRCGNQMEYRSVTNSEDPIPLVLQLDLEVDIFGLNDLLVFSIRSLIIHSAILGVKMDKRVLIGMLCSGLRAQSLVDVPDSSEVNIDLLTLHYSALFECNLYIYYIIAQMNGVNLPAWNLIHTPSSCYLLAMDGVKFEDLLISKDYLLYRTLYDRVKFGLTEYLM